MDETLGKKFGYTALSLRKDQFLMGSLSTHLRYCPACLSESSCYPLTWRFNALLGCAHHQCRLLEHCWHCGNKISLFSSPFKINICSVCAKDLRIGRVDVLTEKELQVTSKRLGDLEFLLSPRSWEKEDNLKEFVGSRFLTKRLRGVNTRTIARHTGIDLKQMKLLDRGGDIKGRTAKFQSYVAYADSMGFPLSDLFGTKMGCRFATGM